MELAQVTADELSVQYQVLWNEKMKPVDRAARRESRAAVRDLLDELRGPAHQNNVAVLHVIEKWGRLGVCLPVTCSMWELETAHVDHFTKTVAAGARLSVTE